MPLDFEYRSTTLHRSIEELLATGKAPIYLVHFTQRDATEAAQSYLSLDPLNKDEKERVKELIGGFRFDSPFGRTFRRFLVGGIGIHHAGLLPKYRLLVERLAQAGLLKIICGTDTLGVGVNVPIRSVLFTQLCKYDGTSSRILRVREFQQIAGRAGRRGFDDRGDVWVQAPPHVVDNERNAKAAETDPRKKKAVKKKAPEKGYVHWSKDTFDRLVNGEPEPLTSSFDVNHQMIMSLLDRPGDGCRAVRRLMVENHEPRRRQRQHIRRSISIYRSLADAALLEFPSTPDELGRRVRVNFDLQDEFALHQPLSLWAIEAIGRLDRPVPLHRRRRADSAPRHAREPEPADSGSFGGLAELLGLVPDDEPDAEPDAEIEQFDEVEAVEESDDVSVDTDTVEMVSVDADAEISRALAILTVIEAVQENPQVVIAAQLRRAKDLAMAEMKSAGVEYEERMARLAKVEPPRPMKDWIYGDFNEFRTRHPWVGGDTVKPKSVARDLFERAMTFGEYVDFYGLKQSEGAILRYLSDVYKGLLQNVPMDAGSDELDEIVHWLGALVRSVDSSLLDEWERLRNPDPDTVPIVVRSGIDPDDITSDARMFRTMVRNHAFGWIEQLARKHVPADAADDVDLLDDLAAYWEEYAEIVTGADARNATRFAYDAATGAIVQTIHDPDGHDEWRLLGQVDLATTRAESRLVASLLGVARL